MHGSCGTIGSTVLESGAHNFERNRVDAFVIRGADIGAIESIDIGHNCKGVAADWHLAQVQVLHRGTGEHTTFPCHQWLPPKGAAATTPEAARITLRANEMPDGAGHDVVYQVTVATSSDKGAGTDANVRLVIYGADGATEAAALESSSNDFERGSTGTFYVTAADVGAVQRLQARATPVATSDGLASVAKIEQACIVQVSKDTAGLWSDWKLDSIDVLHPITNERTSFPFFGWLSKEAGLSHTLHPVTSPEGATRLQVTYEVTVVTSQRRGAGTDADVFVDLVGDQGSLEDRKLTNNSWNLFERGQTDVFEVQGAPIGTLQAVRFLRRRALLCPGAPGLGPCRDTGGRWPSHSGESHMPLIPTGLTAEHWHSSSVPGRRQCVCPAGRQAGACAGGCPHQRRRPLVQLAPE